MKSYRLWIGIVALLIVAILVFGTVSANQDLDLPSSGTGRSVNPELSAAQRQAEANRGALERDHLAINPELKSASDSSETISGDETVEGLAVNPEVYFAQRYAESARMIRDRERIWDANPELSAANRFAETLRTTIGAADLYQNPELKAMTYVGTTEAYDEGTFRANPELKVHRRFVAGNGE